MAPSWNAPSSKLVRVRSEGLKNTRAMLRPQLRRRSFDA
jgi:hypothetical protein